MRCERAGLYSAERRVICLRFFCFRFWCFGVCACLLYCRSVACLVSTFSSPLLAWRFLLSGENCGRVLASVACVCMCACLILALPWANKLDCSRKEDKTRRIHMMGLYAAAYLTPKTEKLFKYARTTRWENRTGYVRIRTEHTEYRSGR